MMDEGDGIKVWMIGEFIQENRTLAGHHTRDENTVEG
jgi:hypothetical protein